MKLFQLILFIYFFSLAGCVGMESTFKPYDMSGGYGEEKIADDAFIVFFDANSFTPQDLTKKYFLKRSAQLTLKNTFDCFVIHEEKKTLFVHYQTSHKLALKSKHYSASEKPTEINANKLDENSLSGIIQMYKNDKAPNECINADQALSYGS